MENEVYETNAVVNSEESAAGVGTGAIVAGCVILTTALGAIGVGVARWIRKKLEKKHGGPQLAEDPKLLNDKESKTTEDEE